MVEDFANETNEDLAAVVVTENPSTLRETDHEATSLVECVYCGHLPCGCGG